MYLTFNIVVKFFGLFKYFMLIKIHKRLSRLNLAIDVLQIDFDIFRKHVIDSNLLIFYDEMC